MFAWSNMLLPSSLFLNYQSGGLTSVDGKACLHAHKDMGTYVLVQPSIVLQHYGFNQVSDNDQLKTLQVFRWLRSSVIQVLYSRTRHAQNPTTTFAASLQDLCMKWKHTSRTWMHINFCTLHAGISHPDPLRINICNDDIISVLSRSGKWPV